MPSYLKICDYFSPLIAWHFSFSWRPLPPKFKGDPVNYLSATELSELIGCKANQKKAMQDWLYLNQWKFEVDRRGLPKVARGYHDRKMGLIEETTKARHADIPNLHAFI